MLIPRLNRCLAGLTIKFLRLSEFSKIHMQITSLGQIRFFQPDLKAARSSFEQALAVFKKIDDMRFAQDAQMGLAEVDMEEDQAYKAEVTARAVLTGVKESKDLDTEASVEVLLSRALRLQHKLPEALRLAQHARELETQVGNRAGQIDASAAEAEVRSDLGEATVAYLALQKAVSDAHKTGLKPLEFQSRVLLGEVELKVGRAADARARLSALEHEAQSKGFILFARKAAAARKHRATS
jgi:tetratricopeptide (TPR) repeat protein